MTTISRRHKATLSSYNYSHLWSTSLFFTRRTDNAVDKRHASLFNGSVGRAETVISRCCYSAHAAGGRDLDKNISGENLTMCSNPHWNYLNRFYRQTFVDPLPFPEKWLGKKTPGMRGKSECFQCAAWPLLYICAQLRNTYTASEHTLCNGLMRQGLKANTWS